MSLATKVGGRTTQLHGVAREREAPADERGARERTVGPDVTAVGQPVALGAARPHEPAALLRLQRMAGNQAVQRLLHPPVSRLIQRANPADRRLPLDQAEALVLAGRAKTDIDAALAGLATASDPKRRNTPDFIAQHNLLPMALTPRHDSAVLGPRIHFFPGQNNYSGSFIADPETTHNVGPQRRGVWVRARTHDDVDAALTQGEIEERLVAAVSEISHTKSARPGQANIFDRYRARFNALFEVPPFDGMSSAFDPALGSRGPRTERAKAVFERIMADETTLRAAYEADTNGVREPIDTYTGPEGMNRVNSPRLQALRAAFFPFPVPVPASRFPAFKAAIQGAAADLDAADREAIDRSNDWQRLINDHVTTDDQRTEVRAIIAGTGGPGGVVPGLLDLAGFLAVWQPSVRHFTGVDFVEVASGTPRYRSRALQIRALAQLPAGQTNAGLVIFVRSQALRGSAPATTPETVLFPARGAEAVSRLSVEAPAVMPPAGDALTVRIEILDATQAAVLDTKDTAVTAQGDQPYTQQEAEAAAAADAQHLNDAGSSGLLGKMTAMGGNAKNVAEAIAAGVIRLRPLTTRHDSAAFVAAAENRADPSQHGYFMGAAYGAPANSFVAGATLGGANIAFGEIIVNRTMDVGTGEQRPDEGKNGIIEIVLHEGVHALDEPAHRPDRSAIESYKAEFRAFWMDGSFGPPDSDTCPTPPGDCRSTAYDPALPAPGPKSPRARKIFEHLFEVYEFVKPNYDDNVDGFREIVDDYIVPDGINLIVSVRLERLRALIEGWDGTSFPAFAADVLVHAATLTTADTREIHGNRAWRDLVERKVRNAAQRAQIETDLGIPNQAEGSESDVGSGSGAPAPVGATPGAGGQHLI